MSSVHYLNFQITWNTKDTKKKRKIQNYAPLLTQATHHPQQQNKTKHPKSFSNFRHPKILKFPSRHVYCYSKRRTKEWKEEY